MMRKFIALGIIVSLFLPGYGFAQPDSSGEIGRMIAGLESSSRKQRVNAAKVISRSGFQDQELYKKVAEIIENGYMLPYEKDRADEIAWMCKALAASGDISYRALLEEVAQNSPSVNIKRHARKSSESIEYYAERSKILNKSSNLDEGLTPEDNRLVNMLRSGDVTLQRDAAKTITRKLDIDDKVFAVVAETLKSMAETYRSDNFSIDTMAWLCKALGASGDKKYIDDLEDVRNNTQSGKLQKYARKAMKDLD
jgi:hypothetical protein